MPDQIHRLFIKVNADKVYMKKIYMLFPARHIADSMCTKCYGNVSAMGIPQKKKKEILVPFSAMPIEYGVHPSIDRFVLIFPLLYITILLLFYIIYISMEMKHRTYIF